MIEGILSWLFLFCGIITQNTGYFVASGVFAIAGQIYQHGKGGE